MDNTRKTFDFIKGNLMNIIVILTSVVYILFGMITLVPTGLSVWECLTKGALGIAVGLLIKTGVAENGFSKGYSSEIWTSNFSKYKEACNLANPYLDKIDNFYLEEEIEKKKQYRREMMMGYQMKYEWFFDAVGNYKENVERYAKLTKKQRKCLSKCVKLKVYNLNLFSEYSTSAEQSNKKEKTDTMQRANSFGKNSLTQVIVAIIGVYFVPQLNGWNWGAILISTIQVVLWVLTGVIQQYTNYNYITIDKVNKLARKKELIVKFTTKCKDDPNAYSCNPYDKELNDER